MSTKPLSSGKESRIGFCFLSETSTCRNLRAWVQVLPTPNLASFFNRVVQRMARACLAVVIASGLALGLGNTCVEEHSLMQQRMDAEAPKFPVSFLQTWQLANGHPASGSHSPESLGELTQGLKKMAKSRKEGSKLDESSSGALDGIQKQMDKIKRDTLDDHNTAIKQLNALYVAMTSCQAPSSSKPEAAKDKLEGQHGTCRGEEASALGRREVARVEYEALTSPPQPCFAQFNDGSLGTLQHHDRDDGLRREDSNLGQHSPAIGSQEEVGLPKSR